MVGQTRWVAWGLLVALMVLTTAGCQGMRARRAIARAEPELIFPGDAEGTYIASAPMTSVSFVDRHPILSKPRDYYLTGGESPLARTAAATFIGIPAGVVGQVRQIVVGVPPAVAPY